MRPWIGLLFPAMFVAVLAVGPAGCGKKEKPAPRAEAPAGKGGGLPPPPTQAKEEPRKEEPKNEAPPEPAKQDAKDAPPVPTKAPIRGGSIVRRVDVVDVMQMMKNLDLATKNFQAEKNRYPNSREELENYYEKNGKINEALKNGDIVYVWKAQRADEPDKTVIAYEGQPDTAGIRVILLANGETKQVGQGEFMQLAKMPTKK